MMDTRDEAAQTLNMALANVSEETKAMVQRTLVEVLGNPHHARSIA